MVHPLKNSSILLISTYNRRNRHFSGKRYLLLYCLYIHEIALLVVYFEFVYKHIIIRIPKEMIVW